MELDRHAVVDMTPSDRWPFCTRANITDVWPGPAPH